QFFLVKAYLYPFSQDLLEPSGAASYLTAGLFIHHPIAAGNLPASITTIPKHVHPWIKNKLPS
ncbi:MAG: hypothetical protein LBV12_07230, partial [Puniceicoccales bacterium]|nr:hypothetical protein [Puniceicoccales bacterium]